MLSMLIVFGEARYLMGFNGPGLIRSVPLLGWDHPAIMAQTLMPCLINIFPRTAICIRESPYNVCVPTSVVNAHSYAKTQGCDYDP